MKNKLRIFLFLAILLNAKGFSQAPVKEKVFVSAIADKDTFEVNNPINKELKDYFHSSPLNYIPTTKKRIELIGCGKQIAKKEYWYTDKWHSRFVAAFACEKDKCPFFVFSEKGGATYMTMDTLIELRSNVSEPLFGKNDFINQKLTDIVLRFGKTYIKKNGYLIYHDYTDKILILNAPKDKVISYKFVRLNKSIKMFSDLDKEIFKF